MNTYRLMYPLKFDKYCGTQLAGFLKHSYTYEQFMNDWEEWTGARRN